MSVDFNQEQWTAEELQEYFEKSLLRSAIAEMFTVAGGSLCVAAATSNKPVQAVVCSLVALVAHGVANSWRCDATAARMAQIAHKMKNTLG